jgi:BON domain
METVRTALWLWLALLMTLVGPGCNRQDTECLARISHKAAERTGGLPGGLLDTLANGWHGAQAVADDGGLEGRVAARLRWEQSLVDVKINIRSKDGAIELSGTVPDLDKRRRAIAVAETTAGVSKVVDSLQLPEQKP